MLQQWLKDINYDAVAGVDNLQLDKSSKSFTVYSISGSLIGKDLESVDGLDKGLYIINGKKTCK